MAAGFASAQLQADRGHIFSKILYLKAAAVIPVTYLKIKIINLIRCDQVLNSIMVASVGGLRRANANILAVP